MTWEERPRTLRSAPEPTHRNSRSAPVRDPAGNRPLVGFGIGLSMFVKLGANPQQAWVEISAAGVDLM